MTEVTEMKQPPTEFGEYNIPSRDRIELYGDDQLINVWWRGNIFIVCPGCFRVPRAMKWGEFVSQIVGPWASADPDFDAGRVTNWKMDDQAISPSDEDTLESVGIEHKGLVSFELA